METSETPEVPAARVSREVPVGNAIAERFVRLAEFIGFGEEDVRRIGKSRQVLLPVADAIVDAVYAHLVSWPETRPFFTDATGAPDTDFLAKRKETLTQWLLASLDVRLDAPFAEYLYRLGEAHRRAGVPVRYITATIAFAQAALTGIIGEAMAEGDRTATIQAWNKLLMLELDLMLASGEAA